MLATHFSRVVATDASQEQIAQAPTHERIRFGVAPAERSGLPDGGVDLILVAQAAHWFAFDTFYEEVRRVAAPGGILALASYGLLRIQPEVDALVDHLYGEVVGPYWPEERKYIEHRYENLPFPFEVLPMPDFHMGATWSFDHLIGYLGTWSATRRYRKQQGTNPIDPLLPELRKAWGAEEHRTVHWDLFHKVARLD